ncbi:Dimethylaniline monooxygenase [N-oxide-forming], partial [Lachnellula hyalina]
VVGLVTLKYLLSAHKQLSTTPVEARLFEANNDIGGVFCTRVYEDAELVSFKYLTTFSDFRPHDSDPDFLSAKRYLQYLNDYCEHFNLSPAIYLATVVIAVKRLETGVHMVSYRSKDGVVTEWACDAIAVCSGLHVTPSIPSIDGIDRVQTVIHSADFKARSQFGVDKTVAILGPGETGLDISYLAITSPTKRVVLCHHDGFCAVPKQAPEPVMFPMFGGRSHPKPDPNVPIDTVVASLFDTAYVHPTLRDSKAHWNYYDNQQKTSMWFMSGTREGLDQWVGGIPEQRYHASKTRLTKSASSLLHKVYQGNPLYLCTISDSPIVHHVAENPLLDHASSNRRHIDLAPWPSHISDHGLLHFQDNGRPEYQRMRDEKVKPDVVILATGYNQTFPFFETEGFHGSYPSASDADVREI